MEEIPDQNSSQQGSGYTADSCATKLEVADQVSHTDGQKNCHFRIFFKQMTKPLHAPSSPTNLKVLSVYSSNWTQNPLLSRSLNVYPQRSPGEPLILPVQLLAETPKNRACNKKGCAESCVNQSAGKELVLRGTKCLRSYVHELSDITFG